MIVQVEDVVKEELAEKDILQEVEESRRDPEILFPCQRNFVRPNMGSKVTDRITSLVHQYKVGALDTLNFAVAWKYMLTHISLICHTHFFLVKTKLIFYARISLLSNATFLYFFL